MVATEILRRREGEELWYCMRQKEVVYADLRLAVGRQQDRHWLGPTLRQEAS